MSSTTLAVVEAFSTGKPVTVGAMSLRELNELLKGISDVLSKEA